MSRTYSILVIPRAAHEAILKEIRDIDAKLGNSPYNSYEFAYCDDYNGEHSHGRNEKLIHFRGEVGLVPYDEAPERIDQLAQKLAKRIVDSFLTHPDCGKKIAKDRESLELVAQKHLMGWGKAEPSTLEPQENEARRHDGWLEKRFTSPT